MMLKTFVPVIPISQRPVMKNMIRVGITAAVLSLGLTAPSAAATLEDALAAYERGDYATAIPLFRAFADQGNAVAQFNLGLMYEDGNGVPQDNAIAVSWYQKAADKRNVDAQSRLGFIYEYGYGVPLDAAIAASWYQKAADQGDAVAQLSLASMYERGWGVPQDFAVAASWYQKAADQGDARAQETLGRMYEDGRGVPKDYVAAYLWFNLVAHYIPGLLNEDALTLRDEVAAKMTPEQMAEAEKRFEAAARPPWIMPREAAAVVLGLSPSAAAALQDGLAAYERGDYATATSLLRPLADHGDVEAQIYLGVMYEDGAGMPKDYVAAHMWFNLAARHGPGGCAPTSECDRALKHRERVAAKMTSEQIAEAEKRFAEWRRGPTP
jgi:uncharacterized protein